MNIQQMISEKYRDADEIHSLQRKKVGKTREKILDALVCLFTPLAEISETADMISDMGTYFLVIRNGRELLVRAEKSEITEMDITGQCEGRKFVIYGNKFTKVRMLNEKKI